LLEAHLQILQSRRPASHPFSFSNPECFFSGRSISTTPSRSLAGRLIDPKSSTVSFASVMEVLVSSFAKPSISPPHLREVLSIFLGLISDGLRRNITLKIFFHRVILSCHATPCRFARCPDGSVFSRGVGNQLFPVRLPSRPVKVCSVFFPPGEKCVLRYLSYTNCISTWLHVRLNSRDLQGNLSKSSPGAGDGLASTFCGSPE